MVEIIFGDNRELACLEGKTVTEARKEYEFEFDIPGRAEAVLNGVPLKKNNEANTKLDEGDELCFVVKTRVRAPMLIAAALVALALTSGVFAYTFVTDSVSLSVTAGSADFATVSSNTSQAPTWSTYGKFRGAISGNATLFDVDTATAGYPGDFGLSVSLSNADSLSKVYRTLTMKLELYGSGHKVDINSDNTIDNKDFVLLSLKNGSVDLYISPIAADNYTLRMPTGSYNTNVYAGWGTGDRNPSFFAEVFQR